MYLISLLLRYFLSLRPASSRFRPLPGFVSTTNIFGEPNSGEVMFFVTSQNVESGLLCKWLGWQTRTQLHESVWKKDGREGVQSKARSLSLGIIRPYNAVSPSLVSSWKLRGGS
jgi:hypothetical protein